MIKFHNQNQLYLSGLLLLAAFSKNSGNPYEQSRALMDQALASLGMAVKLCGVE